MADNAVVFVGGLLSAGRDYRHAIQALSAHTSGPLSVVDIDYGDWLVVNRRQNWIRLLDKIDRAARAAAQLSPTGKITLIGHSAGGILSRLYLSREPFFGRVYGGVDWVDRLVTLGSPNTGEGPLLRGGDLLGWVDRTYPGTAFAPQVTYTSVAGRSIRGRRVGSPAETWAYGMYRALCGRGSTLGDGMIPADSALLPGSRQVVIEGARHYPHFGWYWYLNPEAIPQWWG
jgi:pimeloyl-ACP methyl ester carboxylesterase